MRLATRRLVFALTVLIGGTVVHADEPPKPPPAPAPAAPAGTAPKPAPAATLEQTADAVLAAVQTKDDAALKTVAARDVLDPWLVADELIRRGEFDAAAAFAKAARHPDVEALPGHVEARRARGPEDADRALLAAVEAALASRNPQKVLEDTETLAPEVDTPVRVLLRHVRSAAFKALRRPRDCAAAARGAADAAVALGWLRRGALIYDLAVIGLIEAFEPAQALAVLEICLPLNERRGDRLYAARSLVQTGVVQASLGNTAKAVAAYDEALARFEALGNKSGILWVLLNASSLHQRIGDHVKELAVRERAQPLLEEFGDRAGAADNLNSMGTALIDLGDHARALVKLEDALARVEALGDKAAVAGCLVNIGNAYRGLGDRPNAMAHYERGRALAEEVGHRPWLRNALLGIGLVHMDSREHAKALATYRQLLAQQEGWGDKAGVAAALGGIADVQRSLGNHAEQLEVLERLLKASKDLGDRAGAAGTMVNIGLVHYSLANYPKALEYYERGLKEAEAAGQRQFAANALNNLGNAHLSLGNYAKVLECYERALEMSRDLGDRAGAAGTLVNIGMFHGSLGNYPRALEYHERALREAEAAGQRQWTANALSSIGHVHASLGNYPKALEYQERALKTMEDIGNRAGVASVLGSIGTVHASLGSYPKALEYLERSLEEAEVTGERQLVANALGNVGNVHLSLRSYAKALEYYQRTLELNEEFGNRGAAAMTRSNMGIVLSKLGHHAKALEYQEQALKVVEDLGERRAVAMTLGFLGDVHQMLGNHPKALEYDERALKMLEDLGDRAEAAKTLVGIGTLSRETGDLPKATKSLERAVREAERIRADPVLSLALKELAKTQLAAGDSRGALFSAKSGIRLLERMLGGLAEEQGAEARGEHVDLFGAGALAAARGDDAAEAVCFLESGRAGSLMESLGGRQALRWQSLPEDLRRADVEARAEESVALAVYTKALDRGVLAESKAALKTLDVARAKVSEVVERIQRAAKKDAKLDLFYPRAATLEEIQGWLGAGEALVLYGLCLDEALAMVLTREDARIVALGKASDVTAACEALHLDDPQVDPSGALAALRMLLVAPLGLKDDVRRVLASPEGPLSYVPMAALFDREVAYQPSGTTYGLLLDDGAMRGEQVLALGDPDYAAKFDSHAMDTYAPAPQRGGRLARLPGTRDEATAVGNVTLLGKDASEAGLEASIAGKKGRWRGMHFACHGLVDPERPALSSLALTPDAENDGFLTALEVLRMEVPADLVVLSACETGKGKIAGGEGIVGLTRAFMFAGAPRVICSLWKVDDEATRALMTKFYELWNPKDGTTGLPTAEALRNAQEFVRSHEKWKHPYYWAAWVLWGLPS